MITVKEIISPFTSSRTIPINVCDVDRWLFDKEIKKSIDPSMLVTFRNTLLTGWGVIVVRKNFSLNQLAGMHMPSFVKWKSTAYIGVLFRNILTGKVIRRNSAIFLMEDSFSGYFHWMTEALPRLLIIRKSVNEKLVAVPEHFKQYRFIEQSLSLLGFKILYLKSWYFFSFGRLYYATPLSTPGNYNDPSIQLTRKSIREQQVCNVPESKIYISRRKAGRRKLKNEDSLHKIFEEFEIKIIFCEDLSFEEQVAVFSNARLVVANHGAGITNILSMQPGTALLELRHEADSKNNCYFSLASALNIKYYYQLCRPEVAGEIPHLADLIADENTLRNNLLQILK